MAHRRFHYDRAFEHYLRANAVAYVAVDEAKRALHAQTGKTAGGATDVTRLKSFDFVVYAEQGANLLVDVKGRKHSGKTGRSLQNWVTRDDVESLRAWAGVFGEGFEPTFVFLFWCDAQPPDALFLETFEYGERWYAALAIRLSDYEPHAVERSKSWDTVSIPAEVFTRRAVTVGELLG